MKDEPWKRRWHWCDSSRRLTCPEHHHTPHVLDFNESGFFRCQKWIAEEKRECGLWSFVLALRGDGVIVCEVTLADKERMKKLDTPAAMINYLRIFEDTKKGAA